MFFAGRDETELVGVLRQGIISTYQRLGEFALNQAGKDIRALLGEDGRPPVRVPVSIMDLATGMWTVIGILAAHAERARTGKGGIVDTSLIMPADRLIVSAVAQYSVPIGQRQVIVDVSTPVIKDKLGMFVGTNYQPTINDWIGKQLYVTTATLSCSVSSVRPWPWMVRGICAYM